MAKHQVPVNELRSRTEETLSVLRKGEMPRYCTGFDRNWFFIIVPQ